MWDQHNAIIIHDTESCYNSIKLSQNEGFHQNKYRRLKFIQEYNIKIDDKLFQGAWIQH